MGWVIRVGLRDASLKVHMVGREQHPTRGLADRFALPLRRSRAGTLNPKADIPGNQVFQNSRLLQTPPALSKSEGYALHKI